MEWLSQITDLADIIEKLTNYVRGNNAKKARLIRELKVNLRAFEVQRRKATANFDLLLKQLSNREIRKQIDEGYNFNRMRNELIQAEHIHHPRNKNCIGKDCKWVFEHIDLKIEELRFMQQSAGSLNQMEGVNLGLQFSNLYHRLRLLADFIC